MGLHCTLELTEAVTALTRLNAITSDATSTQMRNGLMMFHSLAEESLGMDACWVSVSILRDAAPERLPIIQQVTLHPWTF